MSQTQQILNYLNQGNTITPIEALSLFGCFRLGARVNDLRNQGIKIETETVHENGKHFARYRLANPFTQL